MNSLGKDAAVCLEWLNSPFVFKKRSDKKILDFPKVVSVNLRYLSEHPDDETYWCYQQKRYPNTQFVKDYNNFEVSFMASGRYQRPEDIFYVLNHFEYEKFEFKKLCADLMKIYDCDYMCLGHSKYESFTRASNLHKKGIVQGSEIYPLGMMSKKEVLGLIKAFDIKIHPSYKFATSSLDTPSYYKMRSSFIAKPEYKESVYRVFPMLALDEYRYEKMLKVKDKK